MSLRDRTLALAGMFQAARLVQQLAHGGRADNEAFSSSVHSVMMLDAGNTDEVFGGVGGVRLGLELLRENLSGKDGTIDVEIARYVVSMLHLASRLGKRSELQDAIRQGIRTAEDQMKFFEPGTDGMHPTLIEKLADLYIQTVGTLPPRIMVIGEHSYLVNSLIAAKVRTALLAGVRAAFLWRQLGGRRWQLLFGRRKLATKASDVLGELNHG